MHKQSTYKKKNHRISANNNENVFGLYSLLYFTSSLLFISLIDSRAIYLAKYISVSKKMGKSHEKEKTKLVKLNERKIPECGKRINKMEWHCYDNDIIIVPVKIKIEQSCVYMS